MTCPNVPPDWFVYAWPLPEVPGAPVPSVADYRPQNVAPLIEFFASILGVNKTELEFRYENNTPHNPNDDIFVRHPGDKDYLPAYLAQHNSKSPEELRYEFYAKRSKRLALFEECSPAKIKYFQPLH